MRRTLLTVLLFAVTALAPGSSAADPAQPPVVYVVGDSIAAGWGAGGLRASFPERIFDRTFGPDRLHARTVATAGRCLVAAGCAGLPPLVDTWSAEVLNATPTPTVVVLEIGTNDLSKVSDAQLEAGYQQVVSQSQARGVRVLVATIPPREASQWPSYWWWGPQLLRVNDWIRQAYAGTCVDFYSALVGSDGWMRPAVGSGDGVHPNRYGHLDLGDAVPLAKILVP